MGRTTLFAALGAGICVLAALSCSGGGGGGTGAPPAAATSSVSSGVITGLSSVKLNGQEYQTPNTSFTVDGQPGAENDLKLGMVVTVNGSLSSSGTRTAIIGRAPRIARQPKPVRSRRRTSRCMASTPTARRRSRSAPRPAPSRFASGSSKHPPRTMNIASSGCSR